MIGATVWNLPNECVQVRIWDDDSEKAIVIASAARLSDIIGKYEAEEIWQDGDEMELCYTPNCHELVSKQDSCPLCPGCLAEYQQEQLDYQDMRNSCAYAGVIG